MFPQIFRIQAQIDVKLTKPTVPGAHFIKAHLVDNLFHRGHLFRHQGYAPLPIIDARAAGDQLTDPAGKLPSRGRVTAHLLLAIFEVQPITVRIPIILQKLALKLFS